MKFFTFSIQPPNIPHFLLNLSTLLAVVLCSASHRIQTFGLILITL